MPRDLVSRGSNLTDSGEICDMGASKNRFCIKFYSVATILLMSMGPGSSAADVLSPAQQKIASAQHAVKKNANRYQFHNRLAMAFTQRARETGNPDFYVRAEKALGRSLQLAPKNFDALKIQVWILLGKHDFAKALQAARLLNKRVPDDVMVYGMLTDAYLELGNYAAAERAAQWMLDLHPGNIPGLARAAYLRELYGDMDGAVELLVQAYQRTPHRETEQRAWFLTQIAHIHLMQGKLTTADQLLQQALELFPDYHYALAALAKTRTYQQKHHEAADLRRKHYKIAPHPENMYLLAKALERIGNTLQATAAFNRFEDQARLEIEKSDNANRELIFYYADDAKKPAEALRIARLEIGRRQDIYTRDAYAWALNVNQKFDEARRQLETALKVGVRDVRFFYHAGAIAARQGDEKSAKRYFRLAIELNPYSEWADAARNAIPALSVKKGPNVK